MHGNEINGLDHNCKHSFVPRLPRLGTRTLKLCRHVIHIRVLGEPGNEATDGNRNLGRAYRNKAI